MVIFLALLVVAGASGSSLPKTESIDSAFERFKAVYPARCDGLIREIRQRLAPDQIEEQKKNLETLNTYATNIRGTIADAERALSKKTEPINILQEFNNLRVEITGFRRTLDVVIIETRLARSEPEDALMGEVRKFWKDEYYFSWRFSYEIENWLIEKKG